LYTGVATGGKGQAPWTGIDSVSAEAVAGAAKKLIKTPLALAAVGDVKSVPRRDAIVGMF
jgi:hypothetical protein